MINTFKLIGLLLIFNNDILYTNSNTIKNIHSAKEATNTNTHANIKNTDVTLLFTFFNNPNCLKISNVIQYDITCNSAITLDKCCHNNINIYYPNISNSIYNQNNCLLYNNESISFKCYNTNNKILLINIILGISLCFNIILMLCIYNCCNS